MVLRIDPICGRRVGGSQSDRALEFKSRRYYFCSSRCRVAFERRAERSRQGHLAKLGALFTNGRVRWGLA